MARSIIVGFPVTQVGTQNPGHDGEVVGDLEVDSRAAAQSCVQ